MDFFKSKPLASPTPKTGKDATFIPLGSDLFRAVAVALLDYLKQGGRLAPHAFKKIQEAFAHYVPDYNLNLTHVSPNSPCKAELLERMAYVLRQLAVDELLDKPTQYRELFKEFGPDTLEGHLRSPSTALHFSVLGALAGLLKIQFRLSFVKEKDDVRQMQLISAPCGAACELLLQVLPGEYRPKVRYPHDFKHAAAHCSKNTISYSGSEPGTIQLALDAIMQDDLRLRERYRHYHGILSNMLCDGDITKQTLMDCYTHFVPIEFWTHGIYNMDFFADKNPQVTEGIQCSEDYDTQALIHSLAAWMASEQVDSRLFFDRLDRLQEKVEYTTAAPGYS